MKEMKQKKRVQEAGDTARETKKAKLAAEGDTAGKALKQKGAAAKPGLKKSKEGARKSQDASNGKNAERKEAVNEFDSESGDDETETGNSGSFQLFAAATARKGQAVEAAGGGQKRKATHSKTSGSESQAASHQAEREENLQENGMFKGAMEERGFSELGLEAWLVKSCEQVGLKRPTDIQWNCIGAALQGRDMLASAETGSGKTAAFALPILQQLAKDPFGVFGLVLTPTRELAFQIQVVVGGMDMMKQALELCTRPHVVVATPGRMADHVSSSAGVSSALRRVKYLVLDEADRLLEPCFEENLGTILQVLPPQRVTWLFSATITASMQELRRFAMKDCFEFTADDPTTTVATVTEKYMHVPKMVKECYLVHALRESKAKSLIVFTGTKATCQFLSLLLEECGEEVSAIHSGLKQLKRLANLDKFKCGRSRVLVATDVAGRGLDIPAVELVVNYDIPQAAKDYIHRVTQYDVELVQNIEQSTGKQMQDAGVREDDVLPLMSEVMKAKRVAKMKVVELDSEGQDSKRRAGLNRTGLKTKSAER